MNGEGSVSGRGGGLGNFQPDERINISAGQATDSGSVPPLPGRPSTRRGRGEGAPPGIRTKAEDWGTPPHFRHRQSLQFSYLNWFSAAFQG